MNATIKIGKLGLDDDDVWRIMLHYDDGDIFISKKTYPTPEAAQAAALEWANENIDISQLEKQ